MAKTTKATATKANANAKPKNHAKPDSQLKRKQTRAVRSPSARSQSRAG